MFVFCEPQGFNKTFSFKKKLTSKTNTADFHYFNVHHLTYVRIYLCTFKRRILTYNIVYKVFSFQIKLTIIYKCIQDVPFEIGNLAHIRSSLLRKV